MKTTHSPSQNHSTRRANRPTGIGARRAARVNTIPLLGLILVLLGAGGANALASDPVGIYALVDKVVFEPSEANAERVQVWGAFAIAEGRGYDYKKAERGYLYYKINPAKPAVCKNEWADLKSVAGTGQIVAFGFRHEEKGALRKKDAKPENPDVYPIAMGLKKIREERDYEPLKQLAKLREQKPKDTREPSAKN